MARQVKNKVAPKMLQQMNTRRIFEILQLKGPMSRANLSEVSHISVPTVSRIIESLIEQKFVDELPDKVNSGTTSGRPTSLVTLSQANKSIIGAVLNVDSCEVALTGLDGKIDLEHYRQWQTPESYADIIKTLAANIKTLIGKAKAKVLGICLSVPGFSDPHTQTVVYSPNLHVTDGKNIATDLGKAVGQSVITIPESDALCLSERTFGRYKGVDDLAVIDISQGCGVGIMRNGELLSSRYGLGMEFGHITAEFGGKKCGCGNRGCFETIITDVAFARQISKLAGKEMNISQALKAIKSGIVDANDEVNHMVDYLAVAIAIVINLFKPSTILLHGQFFDVKEDVFNVVVKKVMEHAFYPLAKDCIIGRTEVSKINGAISGVLDHIANTLGPKYIA